mmetsp:Transcript_36619/g.94768  ORF Transcript_36619/g.94768 Transcript_36619/m.94768 type:complete len:392 (-) Transcript_36619:892-2067(-)
MPGRPASCQDRIPRHAVGLAPDSREVVPADLFETTLRPVIQRAPSKQLASRGEVREVDKGRPIDSPCTLRPEVVTFREALHQLMRDRRHKDAVVLGVDAQTVTEALKRSPVVNADLEASRRPKQAIDQIDEVPLAGSDHQVHGWIPKPTVEVGKPFNALLVCNEPPREVFTPGLRHGHGHLVCEHHGDELRLQLLRVSELVAQLPVSVPWDHNSVAQLLREVSHDLPQPAPELGILAQPQPHVMGGSGHPEIQVVQELAQCQHQHQARRVLWHTGTSLSANSGVRHATEHCLGVASEVGYQSCQARFSVPEHQRERAKLLHWQSMDQPNLLPRHAVRDIRLTIEAEPKLHRRKSIQEFVGKDNRGTSLRGASVPGQALWRFPGSSDARASN